MRKWHLQIEPGTWVLWGYGRRGPSDPKEAMFVEPAKIELGHGLDPLPFKLPKESVGGGRPTEYARRKGYGWRWNLEDGTAGHSWRFADTIEEAIEDATQSLEHQRFDTQKLFAPALRDVRIGGKKYK